MTQPAEWPVPILHDESDWLAVDKPYGLSVHNKEDSTNLLQVLEQQFSGRRFYPVHRLDKETSGIQLLAKSEKAASDLAQQFQNHQVKKIYQGIVAGTLPAQGSWNEALSDKAEGWKNPAGLAVDRVACETRFRSLRNSKYFTWLEFKLLTGRQHQIRKHCALAGRALIGDPRYGNPKYNQKISELYGFHRMALHCTSLTLQSGFEVKSKAPPDFELLFPAEN
jgi:tRNA pseudouridine65 synthase